MNSNFLRTPALFLLLMCASAFGQTETLWIDVRSELEHRADHIEGDIRISHDEIVQEIGAIEPNKNTEVLLYCRSGGRAGKAADALRAAGYANVRNVGGIDDARRERGLGE